MTAPTIGAWLNWDQINAVRHHRYNDLSTVLPVLTTQFQERSGKNPDFIYLEDQIALAAATREITELPLNEQARKALRESQEAKALAIENKRRKARGEELLTSLDEEAGETDEETEADLDAEEQDPKDDVLLMEAGNVLADALIIKRQRFAAHSPTES